MHTGQKSDLNLGMSMHTIHKSDLNLGHVYAHRAKVCPETGARLCTPCISLPQIWFAFSPPRVWLALNFRHIIPLSELANCPFPDTMSVQKWTLRFMHLLIINELRVWHGFGT